MIKCKNVTITEVFIVVVNFYLNTYDTPLIELSGSGISEQDRECMFLKTIESKGHNTRGGDANH